MINIFWRLVAKLLARPALAGSESDAPLDHKAVPYPLRQ